MALVDVGYDVVVDVELFPLGEGGHAATNKIGGGGENFSSIQLLSPVRWLKSSAG